MHASPEGMQNLCLGSRNLSGCIVKERFLQARETMQTPVFHQQYLMTRFEIAGMRRHSGALAAGAGKGKSSL